MGKKIVIDRLIYSYYSPFPVNLTRMMLDGEFLSEQIGKTGIKKVCLELEDRTTNRHPNSDSV